MENSQNSTKFGQLILSKIVKSTPAFNFVQLILHDQNTPVYASQRVLCLERVGLIGEDESIIGEAGGVCSLSSPNSMATSAGS